MITGHIVIDSFATIYSLVAFHPTRKGDRQFDEGHRLFRRCSQGFWCLPTHGYVKQWSFSIRNIGKSPWNNLFSLSKINILKIKELKKNILYIFEKTSLMSDRKPLFLITIKHICRITDSDPGSLIPEWLYLYWRKLTGLNSANTDQAICAIRNLVHPCFCFPKTEWGFVETLSSCIALCIHSIHIFLVT